MTETEDIARMDTHDWRLLLRQVLGSAMDDYIKLQHPSYRDKTYLQEAFQNAVDMLFDTDYRLMFIQNSDGEDMSLQDLVDEALDIEDLDTDALRAYVVGAAKNHWEQKEMATINIPDMFAVEGYVYDVVHERGEYEFDYDNRVLYIDRESNDKEQDFITALFEALCLHLDLRISKRNREEISRGFYRVLKVNDALRDTTV